MSDAPTQALPATDVHQVSPRLYRLPLPLPSGGPAEVNTYVIVGDEGVTLVDCGWDSSRSYAALVSGLGALGVSIGDIRQLIITHSHPDHVGLARRIVAESGAHWVMHRRDALYLRASPEEARRLTAETDRWLRRCGIPPAELEATAMVGQWLLSLGGDRQPDVLLEDGERLPCGPYAFRVIATPGHADGLFCLYDERTGVLVSSDHVLERISPQIGLHAEGQGDPLGGYLHSLARVAELPAHIVLPGHGAPFRDLAGRVRALVRHHEERGVAILRALDGDRLSAYETAARLTWRGSADGWQKLGAFDRRLATTETAAHLEHMRAQGRLARRPDGNVYRYHATTSMTATPTNEQHILLQRY